MRTAQINAINPLYGALPYPGQGNIYVYENNGIYKELQVITSVEYTG